MDKTKLAIIRLLLPLTMLALACSLFSSPDDEQILQDGPQLTMIQTSDTPKPTAISSPVPTLTKLLPTDTNIPPSPTLPPTPQGFKVIPAMDIESTSGGRENSTGVDIKAQLFFSGAPGGGGEISCDLSENWSLPAIGDAGWGFYSNYRSICLLAFPLDQEMHVSLYDPEGNLISSEIFVKKGDRLHNDRFIDDVYARSFYIREGFAITDENGAPKAVSLFDWDGSGEKYDSEMVFLDLWFPPVGYPEGSWKLVVEYDDQTVQTSFAVHPKSRQQEIIILGDSYLNPLEGDRHEYHAGDQIFIIGSGFDPNSVIPIGIYFSPNTWEEYSLIFSKMTDANSDGMFWFPFEILPEDELGSYKVIEFAEPLDHLIDENTFDNVRTKDFQVTEAIESPSITETLAPSTDSDAATVTPFPVNPAPKSIFTWISEVAFKSQSSGYFANLKIDSQDDLHLGFFQDTNDIVWWIKGQNNQWITQEQVTGGSGMGFHVSMTLDSKDNPHFAYHSIDTKKQEPFLYYKYWKGNAWMGVYKNSEHRVVNTDLSIALGPDDQPHFVFLEDYGNNLVYAQFGANGFVNQIVGRVNPSVQSLPLVIDQDGHPHLVYQSADQGLVYATQKDENWVWEVVDDRNAAGQYSDIAIDAFGNLHIAYYDQGEANLKYAFRSNDGWEIQLVDTNGNVGQYPSIKVDTSGNIHISYYDVGNTALKYAYGSDGSWGLDTVDNLGSVGEYTSIDLNSKDLPFIIYFDSDNKDLKLARAMPLSP